MCERGIAVPLRIGTNRASLVCLSPRPATWMLPGLWGRCDVVHVWPYWEVSVRSDMEALS